MKRVEFWTFEVAFILFQKSLIFWAGRPANSKTLSAFPKSVAERKTFFRFYMKRFIYWAIFMANIIGVVILGQIRAKFQASFALANKRKQYRTIIEASSRKIIWSF